MLGKLLPCDLPRRVRKLQSSAAVLDISRLSLGEILEWANVEIEGGFAELLIISWLFRNVVFTGPFLREMCYHVTEFHTSNVYWLFATPYTYSVANSVIYNGRIVG